MYTRWGAHCILRTERLESCPLQPIRHLGHRRVYSSLHHAVSCTHNSHYNIRKYRHSYKGKTTMRNINTVNPRLPQGCSIVSPPVYILKRSAPSQHNSLGTRTLRWRGRVYDIFGWTSFETRSDTWSSVQGEVAKGCVMNEGFDIVFDAERRARARGLTVSYF